MEAWKPREGRPTVECTDCKKEQVAFGKFVFDDGVVITRVIRCLNCGQEGEAKYEAHGPKAWLGDGFTITEHPEEDG